MRTSIGWLALLLTVGLSLAPTRLGAQEVPPPDPAYPLPLYHDRPEKGALYCTSGALHFIRLNGTWIEPYRVVNLAKGRVLGRFIKVGMTPEQVRQMLGNPSGRFTGTTWYYDEWSLAISFVREPLGTREEVCQVSAEPPSVDEKVRPIEKLWEWFWHLWYANIPPHLSVQAPKCESIQQPE